MPRQKKSASYHADSATVREFFRRSMEEREAQKDASLVISSLNTAMADAGVHPGVMSFMRRIAATPPGKRGWLVALTQQYMAWLEDELRDPQIDIEEVIAQRTASERGATVTPMPTRRSAPTPPSAA